MRGYYQPASGPPFSRGGYRSMTAAGGGGGGERGTGIASVDEQLGSGTSTWQYGWHFRMETDATLTALRLWGYATNVEVVRLWRVEDEALLAEVTITSENGAWVEESVTEVELESGKEYMATCRHPSGNNRTYRRENPATDAVTFSDAVTSIGDCFATDNGMPVANGAGRIAGLADIVFLA